MKTLPVVGKFASVVVRIIGTRCLLKHRYCQRRSGSSRSCIGRRSNKRRPVKQRLVAAAEVAAEQQRLQDAAMAAGTVFYFAFDSFSTN